MEIKVWSDALGVVLQFRGYSKPTITPLFKGKLVVLLSAILFHTVPWSTYTHTRNVSSSPVSLRWSGRIRSIRKLFPELWTRFIIIIYNSTLF